MNGANRYAFNNDQFISDGFLILKHFLDSESVIELKHLIDLAVENEKKLRFIEGDDFISFRDSMLIDERFRGFLERIGWAGFIESVYGNSMNVVRDEVVIKKASGILKTFWHQDYAYYRIPGLITSVIALDDLLSDSGGYSIVQNSNKQLMEHKIIDSSLIIDSISESDVIDLPIESGDLVLIHPLTVHKGKPNKSQRLSYSYTIMTSPRNDN